MPKQKSYSVREILKVMAKVQQSESQTGVPDDNVTTHSTNKLFYFLWSSYYNKVK